MIKHSEWFAKWEAMLSATNDVEVIEALMDAQTEEFAEIADQIDFNS